MFRVEFWLVTKNHCSLTPLSMFRWHCAKGIAEYFASFEAFRPVFKPIMICKSLVHIFRFTNVDELFQ
ncbi:MAG: hypothetical protein BGO64_20200 [Aeromonas sp. 62-46]|nr:MAG: hypothetical protein BGO64_20200 [Aeromonas sp. 62-46]